MIRIFLLLTTMLLVLPGAAQELKTLNRSYPGEHFEYAQFLSRDKTNVIVFHSRHSPASRTLVGLLEQLQPKRRDLAVSLLDVDRRDSQEIDWRSPLVRQYNIRLLPYVVISDRSGKTALEGHQARKQILEWLDQAGLLP